MSSDGPGADPDQTAAAGKRWFDAGNAAFRRGDVAGAVAAYERAVQLSASHPDAWLNLGAAYRRTGRIEAAADAARRALELRPRDPMALNNLANALSAAGRLQEAARCYRQALEIRPADAETWYNLVNLEPLNDGSAESDALLSRLRGLAREPGRYSARQRSALLFAFARALDARGEAEAAFRALAEANALHRSEVRFDLAASERLAAAITERFDAALFERLRGAGSPSELPVFVVGMPRSGTTLVEQILSAHPRVHGAGETGLLSGLVAKVRGPGGAGFPAWTTGLSGADVQRLAQAYLGVLEPLGPGEARITDKSVGNFELLGLIHLAFPNARIVHCRRDPRDTCVSCFATRFSAGHDYAYDLGELGRYWRRYDRLMAHWRAVLPPGRMFEVDYEALVGDLEGWARKLIAHLGLDWDEACLRFHESDRAVATASFAQVRRPIYTGSVGRWRRFEPHLGPLLEALEAP